MKIWPFGRRSRAIIGESANGWLLNNDYAIRLRDGMLLHCDNTASLDGEGKKTKYRAVFFLNKQVYAFEEGQTDREALTATIEVFGA